MNVYVETNFVLEHALEQGEFESCEKLLEFASDRRIQLVIPAFSLAEPHDVLRVKEKTRHELVEKLRSHLTELGRSKRYRLMSTDFGKPMEILSASGEEERDGLQHTTRTMLGVAVVTPLDSRILTSAAKFADDLGLPPKDSIVFASIVTHLSDSKPAESCFLNRNTRDFDNPTVRDTLAKLGCKFFGRFHDGLRYVEGRLSKG